MSANGSTAIDLSEIADTAGASARFDCQERKARATTTRATTNTAATIARFMVPPVPPFVVVGCGEGTAGAWLTASASFPNAACSPSAGTSIQCEFDKKYSRDRLKDAASIRNAMICLCFDAARSVSRPTWDNATALPDKMSTTAFASLIAATMASAYSVPGRTSRGAIQHLIPCRSRASTTELQ